VGRVGDDAVEITEALTRVLDSQGFRRSPRSRGFLAYVVTETLAGRGDRLSQRTVGRHALDRTDSFDDRVDASVRVQANRVRRSLAEYYAADGASDTLRIELPSGRYVPIFIRVPESDVVPEPAAHDGDSTIVILKFPPTGSTHADLIAGALCESLAHALSGFPVIRVIGPTTARASSLAGIGRELGGRFVFQGSVVARDTVVLINVRLSDVLLGDVMWSAERGVDATTLDGFDADTEWAAQIAGELGDYVGIVQRRSMRSPTSTHDSLDFAARLAFHTYIESGDPESLVAADDALGAAMDAGVSSPTLLAMRGSTRAVLGAYGISENPEADLTAAEELASAALIEDPGSGHAHAVLGTVALARKQWSSAIAHARAAEAVCPFHPTVLATAGTLIACAGEWDAGIELLQRALRLNPIHPGYMHTLVAQDRIMAGDAAGALAEASLIDAPGAIWGPLFRAMALDQLGHHEQAHYEFRTARSLDPSVDEDPARLFTAYATLDDEHLTVLVERVSALSAATAETSNA
jgi:TolB-like protein/Flp pilus assembly protein TadD